MDRLKRGTLKKVLHGWFCVRLLSYIVLRGELCHQHLPLLVQNVSQHVSGALLSFFALPLGQSPGRC